MHFILSNIILFLYILFGFTKQYVRSKSQNNRSISQDAPAPSQMYWEPK